MNAIGSQRTNTGTGPHEPHPAASSSPPPSPPASSPPPRAQAKEIRIDFATYNPVSLVLKDKGFLEKELEKDGITVRWVQSLGSNKALEFLNAGSIDFGSTAGAAALIGKINGNPIKSDLRLFPSRMDGARDPQGTASRKSRT